MEIELVIFFLDGERYAFNIDSVMEVVEIQSIMPVPETPDYIMGVVNLRGEILTVLDTKLRLGLRKSVINEQKRLMIIQTKEYRVGIIVDGLPVVVRLDEDRIKSESSAINPAIDAKFIKGEIEDEFLIVLDEESLILGDEET